MAAEDQKLIGRFEAQIQQLTSSQTTLVSSQNSLREEMVTNIAGLRKESNDNFRELFSLVRKLDREGCARGGEHTRRLEALEKRPSVALAMGASLAAIAAAGLTYAKLMMGK